ncbi:MAG: SCO6745 family protein [Acidimicrobiia bacterium]
MEDGSARRVWQFAEPIHAVTYFAPETRAATDALGLRGGWMSYFGCRAAPLGRVHAAVVTATFFNFHPAMVSRAVPDVWDHATPEQLLDARLGAAGDTLERILGDEVRAPALGRTADLAGRAADACDTAGRALAAANAGIGRSAVPHRALWQALTTLREHRGDGHVAVLVGHAITPCEALVLQGATGRSPVDELRVHRGWSEEEWSEAVDALRVRGWLAADGSITDAGARVRHEVEHDTDHLALGPFRALGDDATDDLIAGLRPLAAWVMSAGAVPAANLMGMPWPPIQNQPAQPGRAAPTGLP